MHGLGRASIERRLGAAAFAVGRSVARGAGLLPELVRRASGLEQPSPEAVAAGVVRGITSLASATMGVTSGVCLDVVGKAAVLALATWTVHSVSDDASYGAALADAIEDAEHRGLCSEWTATMWRATAGVAPLDLDVVRRATVRRSQSVACGAVGGTLSCVTNGHRLARTARAGMHALGIGLTLIDAWRAIGDAALLVESTRRFAAERSASCDPDRAVTRLCSRAAA